MENRVQPKERIDDEVQAFLAMIALLICVECAKEPEFRCEKCDKVYNKEGWYNAHVAKCNVNECGWVGVVDMIRPIEPSIDHVSSVPEISELLRQNREMLALLQKQQETIQILVSQLVPVGVK